MILGSTLIGAMALLVGLLVLSGVAVLKCLALELATEARAGRDAGPYRPEGGEAAGINPAAKATEMVPAVREEMGLAQDAEGVTAVAPTLSQEERGKQSPQQEREAQESPSLPVPPSPRPPLPPSPAPWPLAPTAFLLLLIAAGLLLVLGPEIAFLNDSFGTRMNTVFKFHYQAWVLLGLASAVGLAWMAARMRPLPLRGLVLLAAILPVSVGLLYPLGATPAKANGFKASPTLDGAAFYQSIRSEDYAAMRWLAATTTGQPVVLEATGGDYSEYARVSTFTGLPTVLGWAGHELQWRGRGEEPARRTQDIDALYKTADRAALLGLLDKYRVQYVFVGSLEYEKYGQEVAGRFEGLLETVHRQGKVVIYRVPRGANS